MSHLITNNIGHLVDKIENKIIKLIAWLLGKNYDAICGTENIGIY